MNLSSQTGSFAADTWQKLGYCYERASRQGKDLEEFKKLRQLAVEAYRKAADLFEKDGSFEDQGKSASCLAFAEHISSWLGSDPSEKWRMLGESLKYGKEAMEILRKNRDDLNYGRSCNDLLMCLFE